MLQREIGNEQKRKGVLFRCGDSSYLLRTGGSAGGSLWLALGMAAYKPRSAQRWMCPFGSMRGPVGCRQQPVHMRCLEHSANQTTTRLTSSEQPARRACAIWSGQERGRWTAELGCLTSPRNIETPAAGDLPGGKAVTSPCAAVGSFLRIPSTASPLPLYIASQDVWME